MLKRRLPTPVIVPIQSAAAKTELPGKPLSLRELWVQEFLQARSLKPKSRKAYERDLQLFMDWTDATWSLVTRRQIAQFKQYLIDEKQLAPNSINRTLQTLKSFFKQGYFILKIVFNRPRPNPQRPCACAMLSNPKSRYKLSAKLRAVAHNCGKGATRMRPASSP